MGKKRSRKTKTSKGTMNSISKAIIRAVKQNRGQDYRISNVMDAWISGKNPWVTIPGTEPNKRFVRVKANDLWGQYKKVKHNIFEGKKKKNADSLL